jgi:hypothetical protein
MKIQSLHRVLHLDPVEAKRDPRSLPLLILALSLVCSLVLCSCGGEGEPIGKPDEFTRVYQANEKYILRAIYQTFKEKELGQAISKSEETQEVTSDYIVQGGWRIRALARISKVNRSESEVALSIITEKRTPTGWELRRLLGKEHYERFFDTLDTQIYREISRPD